MKKDMTEIHERQYGDFYNSPGFGVEQCRESSGWCKINSHWFEVCDVLVPRSMQHTGLHSAFQVRSMLPLFTFQQCCDTGKSTKWFMTNIFSQNLYDQRSSGKKYNVVELDWPKITDTSAFFLKKSSSMESIRASLCEYHRTIGFNASKYRAEMLSQHH